MEGKNYIMNKLVSIIIPVYNVEKYLSECLDSVIAQIYDNLEILLIDDGSTDNSGKICDKYAQKDSRIKVIHKENGGVSSARNLGLDIAQGEYIAFIDSDDFVDRAYIEKMYNKLETTEADLVFCKYANYIDEKIECVKENLPENLIIDKATGQDGRDFILRPFTLKNYLFFSIWRVLYKSSLIKNIRFQIDIKVGEDLLFLLQAVIDARKISFFYGELYFYRLNRNSVMHCYKKDYLQSQLHLYWGLKKIFDTIDDKTSRKVFYIYACLLCYYVFSNELKIKQVNKKKKIQQIRRSELYKYFTLKNGIRIYGLKRKIKFLIAWFLVKMRLA